jgi:hypothetical protein
MKDEWDGTTVTFDVFEQDGSTHVRFTHDSLTSQFECYGLCSNAQSDYIGGSLRELITTGAGQPNQVPLDRKRP